MGRPNTIELDFEGDSLCVTEWRGLDTQDCLYTFQFNTYSGGVCWKSNCLLTTPEIKDMLLSFKGFDSAWTSCDPVEIESGDRSYFTDGKGFSYWRTAVCHGHDNFSVGTYAKARDRFFSSEHEITPWTLLAHWLQRKLYPDMGSPPRRIRF